MEATDNQKKNGAILYNDCIMLMQDAPDVVMIEYILESSSEAESKLYALHLLIRDIKSADSDEYDSIEDLDNLTEND